MNNSFFSVKKSIGIFLISIGILFVMYLLGYVSPLNFIGNNTALPKDILFTNITDTSFTVTWFTDTLANGKVELTSKNTNKKEFLDERDVTDVHKFLSHSISTHQLEPNTQYSIAIVSNGKKYLDNQQPFQITTAKSIQNSNPNSTPAYGTVMTNNKLPSNDTIVFLSTDDSQILSASVKNNGSFTIPLSELRSLDLSSYINIGDSNIFHVNSKTNNTVTSVTADTASLSPVPSIIVGSNPTEYISSKQSNKSSLTQSVPSIPQNTINNPLVVVPTGPTITFPGEKAVLATVLPLFRGTALPKSTVTITLNTLKPISSTIHVDQYGLWSYSPQIPLIPGKQTVTITSTTSQGQLAAITHSFEILKSGTQVLGEATPSASNTPTPTELLTPTIIASISATPTVVLSLAPSPTVNIPSPTVLQQISSTPMPPIAYPLPPPKTGNSAIPITLILLSIIFVTIGIRFL
jgi:hypothetical protein